MTAAPLTRSSGPPSSASSWGKSSPILLTSHTQIFRSWLHDPRRVSTLGDHCTWITCQATIRSRQSSRSRRGARKRGGRGRKGTSSVCQSKACSFADRFLKSQRATVLSALPVAIRCSLKGLKCTQLISAECAWTCAIQHGHVPANSAPNVRLRTWPEIKREAAKGKGKP